MKTLLTLTFTLLLSSQSFAAISEGNRLLIQAIQQNDVGTVQQTLQTGVDVNALSPVGTYAIHEASVAKVKDQILSILLENRADPNIKDSLGQTALHIAVRASSPSKVKILLDAGADAKATTAGKETALHFATSSKGPYAAEMTQLLLDAEKSNLNQRDRGGYTPLMLAVLKFSPSPRTVRALLDAGADRTLVNMGKFTALDFAEAMLSYFQRRPSEKAQEAHDLEEIVQMLKS